MGARELQSKHGLRIGRVPSDAPTTGPLETLCFIIGRNASSTSPKRRQRWPELASAWEFVFLKKDSKKL